MPLYRLVPKRGFTNSRFKKAFTEINLDDLNKFDADTNISAELLPEKGMISKVNDGIVVLGNGTLNKSLVVKASKFTKTAKEKIEAVGGKAEVI